MAAIFIIVACWMACLHYQAGLAQHQYDQVDPDNRLVAAELERRWEEALQALKQAEDRLALQQQQDEKPPQLPPDLKTAFAQIAQKLPEIWDQEELVSTPHKKALLRCLLDKVTTQRVAPDMVQGVVVRPVRIQPVQKLVNWLCL